MSVIDWDDAYDNLGHVPNGLSYPPLWTERASAYRLTARAVLDLSYGKNDREVFDLFLPEGASKGLAVFVHGGFWVKFDKSVFSHVAAGAVARGWTVAVPSYPLAPNVRISEITQAVARAVLAAAERVDGPIALAGHSAGGHLVSRLVCEDNPLSEPVLARISRCMSISGLHTLAPLMNLTLNESFRMDASEADAESATLHRPVAGVPVEVWVGADERPEFIKQSEALAKAWPGQASLTTVAGRHHLDVIDALSDANSDMVSAWLG